VLLLFGWFGALIVARQPNHPIGWLLCALGCLTALGSFASEYAIYGLLGHPGTAPGAAALAWLTSWLSSCYLAPLAALLALFSNRPPAVATVAVGAVACRQRRCVHRGRGAVVVAAARGAAAAMDLPPGGGHRGYAAVVDGSRLMVACCCSHSMGDR
jgi:hypothetical protein